MENYDPRLMMQFLAQALRQGTLNPDPPMPTPAPTAAEELADAPIGGMTDQARQRIRERQELLRNL